MPEIKKVPKYYIIRMLLVAFVIYLFLVLPVSLSLLFKNLPSLISSDSSSFRTAIQDSTAAGSKPVSLTLNLQPQKAVIDTVKFISENKNPGNIADIGINLFFLLPSLLISGLVIIGYNLPFKLYFNRRRKNKKISAKLQQYAVKHIYRTPLYFGIISFCGFVLADIIMLFNYFQADFSSDLERKLYMELIAVSVLAALLTSVFIYSWQKHRVSLRYIEYIFLPSELQHIREKTSYSKIKNQLWMSGLVTSFLPLIFVIIYIVLSWSSVQGSQLNSTGELKILLGDYGSFIQLIDSNSLNDLLTFFKTKGAANLIYYTNTPNWLILNFGVLISSLASLFYLFMYIRWNTEIIVHPVKELLENIQRTGKGELGLYNLVRSNDEIGQLTEGFNNMSRELETYITHISEQNQAYYRFVPRQLTEYLNKKDFKDIQLGDQIQKEMTILFCDIRDYTAMSEPLSPEENINFLNQYLGYMEPVITQSHGFIDKYIGDAIMAIFPEKPEHAVNAALLMHKKLRELNRVRSKDFKPEISIGIGINTGSVMFGVVGSPERLNATVISDAVNLAFRLEGLTRVYPTRILMSASTIQSFGDSAYFEYRQIDLVRVKGKKEPVGIYELFDCYTDDIKANLVMNRADFEQAVKLYRIKKFDDALNIFKQILSINPEDQICRMYADRCSHLAQYGAPAGWEGIEDIKQK